MRLKTVLTLFLAGGALALIPVLGLTQGPSRRDRGGNNGGMQIDPGRIFDFMARGQQTIQISQMRMGREQAEAWAKKNGITNGQLTREQFIQYSNSAEAQQAAESLRSRFGGDSQGRGGFGRGGDTQGGPPQQGGFGRGRGGDSQGGFGRGGDRGGNPAAPNGGQGQANVDPNARADEFFRRSDRNGDGVLSFDEMSDTLKNERDKWDVNKDGVVDVNEFREYIKAWTDRRRQELEARNAGTPTGTEKKEDKQEEKKTSAVTVEDPRAKDAKAARMAELDKKVTVYRSGKLPPNLPGWFRECDTDQDAQVSLYEWKVSRRTVQEFDRYDLNGDGFITVEELLKNPALALAQPRPRDPSQNGNGAAGTESNIPAGGLPPQGGFGRGGFGRGGDTQGGPPQQGGFGRGGFGRGGDTQGGQPQQGGFGRGGFGRGGDTQGGQPQQGGFGRGGFGRGGTDQGTTPQQGNDRRSRRGR